MSIVLSVDKLSKSYGRIKALNTVSFDVPEGSVFGVLGPNGSGKTTLLGIIMDVLKSNNGNYAWLCITARIVGALTSACVRISHGRIPRWFA